LQKQNANILAVSDGGSDAALSYGSFGWVLGTDEEILSGCKGVARGYPMTSYRAEGYGRISVLSFLTHYLRFLEIQPHDILCIVSYCDNTSLLGREETLLVTGPIGSVYAGDCLPMCKNMFALIWGRSQKRPPKFNASSSVSICESLRTPAIVHSLIV
jgi:hypothetical protein